MERIEELKQELLKQKQLIETKHGKVVVANLNPSPSEITAGIASVTTLEADLADITATQADVLAGKKFVNSSGTLETGSMKDVKWQNVTATKNDVHIGTKFVDNKGDLVNGELKEIAWKSTTATPSDVLIGKRFINIEGDLVYGSMKDVDYENATATAADVLTGKKFVNSDGDLLSGELVPTDFSVVTATNGDVLTGKKFLNSTGTLVEGTLKDVDWQNVTATSADVLAGTKFVDNNGDLVDGEMKDVAWESTTATAADVLTGKKFVNSTGDLVSGELLPTDFSVVTATASDVLTGKQFFNSAGELEDGTLKDVDYENVTATQNDVRAGKKFIDANGDLQNGQLDATDFSQVTATQNDVKAGKQFFNSEGQLVDGQFEGLDSRLLFYVSNFDKNSVIDEEINVVMPDDLTECRNYLFHGIPYKLNVWLGKNTEIIRGQSFYSYHRIRIKNFPELTKLKTIENYGCALTYGIDFGSLPDSIETIGENAFLDNYEPGNALIIPKNCKVLSRLAFACTKKFTMEKLVFTENPEITTIPREIFENIAFTCDFIIPKNITKIDDMAFLGNSFKNLVLPETLEELGGYALASSSVIADTITFLNPVVPKYNKYIFNNMHKSILKIYVPDSSVDDYKQILSGFNVMPLSQRP